jgi:hypothetical protein
MPTIDVYAPEGAFDDPHELARRLAGAMMLHQNEQALAAHGKLGHFYDGKCLAVRYFFNYELPKTTAQFDLLDNEDPTTADLNESWF